MSLLLYRYIPVPEGFRTAFELLVILCLFSVLVITKKDKLFSKLWAVFKCWLPWLVYLLIRTKFSDNGIWKYEMYLVRVFIPCVVLAGMYLIDKVLFEKYFMSTFLIVNVVMLVYLFMFCRTFGEIGDFDRNIWLSRSLGICIFYFITSFRLRKNLFLMIPIIAVFAIAMILINSRGPVLSLLLATTTFFIIKFKQNIGALSITFTVGLIVILFFIYVPSLSTSVSNFSTHHKREKIGQLGGRANVFIPTIKIVVKNQVVGVGFAGWWDAYRSRFLDKHSWFANKFKYEGRRDYSYPHNIILEILSELGIVGFVLFLFLFWPFAWVWTQNNYRWMVLLGFLYASTSSDITQNATPMIFCVLAGVYTLSASGVRYSEQVNLN